MISISNGQSFGHELKRHLDERRKQSFVSIFPVDWRTNISISNDQRAIIFIRKIYPSYFFPDDDRKEQTTGSTSHFLNYFHPFSLASNDKRFPFS